MKQTNHKLLLVVMSLALLVASAIGMNHYGWLWTDRPQKTDKDRLIVISEMASLQGTSAPQGLLGAPVIKTAVPENIPEATLSWSERETEATLARITEDDMSESQRRMKEREALRHAAAPSSMEVTTTISNASATTPPEI